MKCTQVTPILHKPQNKTHACTQNKVHAFFFGGEKVVGWVVKRMTCPLGTRFGTLSYMKRKFKCSTGRFVRAALSLTKEDVLRVAAPDLVISVLVNECSRSS